MPWEVLSPGSAPRITSAVPPSLPKVGEAKGRWRRVSTSVQNRNPSHSHQQAPSQGHPRRSKRRGLLAAPLHNSQLCYRGRKSNQVQPLDAPSWISHPLPSPLRPLPSSSTKPQASSKALESSSFPWAHFHHRRVALLPAAHQGFLLPSHTSWSSSEHGGT